MLEFPPSLLHVRMRVFLSNRSWFVYWKFRKMFSHLLQKKTTRVSWQFFTIRRYKREESLLFKNCMLYKFENTYKDFVNQLIIVDFLSTFKISRNLVTIYGKRLSISRNYFAFSHLIFFFPFPNWKHGNGCLRNGIE